MGADVCGLPTRLFIQEITDPPQRALVPGDTEKNKRPGSAPMEFTSYVRGQMSNKLRRNMPGEDACLEKGSLRAEAGKRKEVEDGGWEGLSSKVAFGNRLKEVNV